MCNMLQFISQVSEQRYLFYGAGAAGVGIADLLAQVIQQETIGSDGTVSEATLQAARERIWLVDSKGLVTAERGDTDLADHKRPFAHSKELLPAPLNEHGSDNSALLAAIEAVRPSSLIGVSAQGGAFDETVCRRMAEINPENKPVIFSLSNPTSKSECSPEDAYRWTSGHVVYSSGSPYAPVHTDSEEVFAPGQSNNM